MSDSSINPLNILMQIGPRNGAVNPIFETYDQREFNKGVSEHIHVVFEQRLNVLGKCDLPRTLA